MKNSRMRIRSGLRVPVLLALGLHGAILAALTTHWHVNHEAEPSQPLVQATLVGIDSAVPQPDRSAPASQAAPKTSQDMSTPVSSANAPVETSDPRSSPSDQDTAKADAQAAKDKADAEAKAKADAQAAKDRADAEAKAKADAQAAKNKADAEAKVKADAKAAKDRADAEAKAKADAQAAKNKADAEAKAKADAKAAKDRADAEAKAKADAKTKETARRKRFAEAAAAAASDDGIGQEQKTRQNAHQAAQAINSMQALIHKAVEQNWYHLPNAPEALSTQVTVNLIPTTGELVSVSVARSSGNNAFDTNAVQAVRQAAPFAEIAQQPASVQQQFKQFTLDFSPSRKVE